jgi:glutathione S-transferase
MVNPDITLYTVGTPNGHKVSIALEVLGIPYKTHAISFANNEQKDDWFLKINPNGRIPAIVDHSNGEFPVFESGAILLYLVENYDPEHKLWPKDAKLQSEVVQWLMFQMGGVGPMQGQANHFKNYAPEKIEYGINRYINETKRLFSVLESRLQGRQYLVGDQLTIADIATVPWVSGAYSLGIDLNEFPNVNAWVDRVEEIPEVAKGYDVPTKNLNKEYKKNPELLKKRIEDSAKWIQAANKQ